MVKPIKHNRSLRRGKKRANDRSTSPCLLHVNVKLLVDRLNQSGLLKASSISELLTSIVCDLKNKKCMCSVTQYRIRIFTFWAECHYLWVWERSHRSLSAGGSMKCCADEFVKKGVDLQSPKELSTTYKTQSSMKYFWIAEDQINQFDEAVPNGCPAVKGTLKMSQIISKEPGKINHREEPCSCCQVCISCECDAPTEEFQSQTCRCSNRKMSMSVKPLKITMMKTDLILCGWMCTSRVSSSMLKPRFFSRVFIWVISSGSLHNSNILFVFFFLYIVLCLKTPKRNFKFNCYFLGWSDVCYSGQRYPSLSMTPVFHIKIQKTHLKGWSERFSFLIFFSSVRQEHFVKDLWQILRCTGNTLNMMHLT